MENVIIAIELTFSACQLIISYLTYKKSKQSHDKN